MNENQNRPNVDGSGFLGLLRLIFELFPKIINFPSLILQCKVWEREIWNCFVEALWRRLFEIRKQTF